MELGWIMVATAVVLAGCNGSSGDDDTAGAEGTATEPEGTDASAGTDSDDPDTGATDAADSTGIDEEVDYVDGLLSGMWADDIVITVNADSIDVDIDGFPNHDVLEAYALMDGTTIGVSDTPITVSIPLEPEYSDTVTDTNMGTIGVAISGGVYFNPYEGDGTTVALDNNFETGGIPFLDACSGHPLPDGGSYHYHGVPYCITDVVDSPGDHSVLIGVLLDGFPIYGAQGDSGDAPTDLDECSGHDSPTPEFPQGIYHYHLTETAPYSIPCFHGVVEVSGGMMPPPGGG